MLASSSPTRFAGNRALHRLFAPRHPPRALCSLTKIHTVRESARLRVCESKRPADPTTRQPADRFLRLARAISHHYAVVREPACAHGAFAPCATLRATAFIPLSQGAECQICQGTCWLLTQKGKTDCLPPISTRYVRLESLSSYSNSSSHRRMQFQQVPKSSTVRAYAMSFRPT